MLMGRRAVLAGGAGVVLAAAAPTWGRNPDWYDRGLIIDGLGSLSDPYAPDGQLRLDERAWREIQQTGVDVVHQTVVPVGNQGDLWTEFKVNLTEWNQLLSANPDRLLAVRSGADLQAAKESGRVGVIFGTQDTSMVGTAFERLAEMRREGIRTVQLTYNLRNLSGDGALEEANGGLSRLGRATIAKIEEEKLLLDLSHGGERTIDEAIAAAKRPLTISHSGARALFDHPRNVHDRAIKGVADKGGVVGVYFMPYLAQGSKPSGEHLIRHIEHVARVAGEDHIGIGTDGSLHPLEINEDTYREAREVHEMRKAAGFSAPGDYPDTLTIVMDYNSLDRFQRLGRALERRGWSAARLEKLFGANLARLYREVWA